MPRMGVSSERRMRRGVFLLFSAILVASCARILGIDGRYVLEEATDSSARRSLGAGGEEAGAETGGTPETGGEAGGAPGSGGIVAAGGTIATSGGRGGTTMGAGGVQSGGAGHTAADSEAPCDPGKKRCRGSCVTPDPSVGCGPTGCEQCANAPPVDGYLVCSGDQCDYACGPGFTKNDATGTCDAVVSVSGGAGGTGGGGGAGGTVGKLGSPCTVKLGPPVPSSECISCGPFPGCCDPVTARCGCLYVAACI